MSELQQHEDRLHQHDQQQRDQAQQGRQLAAHLRRLADALVQLDIVESGGQRGWRSRGGRCSLVAAGAEAAAESVEPGVLGLSGGDISGGGGGAWAAGPDHQLLVHGGRRHAAAAAVGGQCPQGAAGVPGGGDQLTVLTLDYTGGLLKRWFCAWLLALPNLAPLQLVYNDQTLGDGLPLAIDLEQLRLFAGLQRQLMRSRPRLRVSCCSATEFAASMETTAVSEGE